MFIGQQLFSQGQWKQFRILSLFPASCIPIGYNSWDHAYCTQKLEGTKCKMCGNHEYVLFDEIVQKMMTRL